MTIERAPAHPESLVITQAVNGYVVSDHYSPGEFSCASEQRVFPSKAALFAHLAEHFTHEAVSVPMDKAPPAPLTVREGEVVIGVAEYRRPLPVEPGDLGYVSGAGFTEFGRRE